MNARTRSRTTLRTTLSLEQLEGREQPSATPLGDHLSGMIGPVSGGYTAPLRPIPERVPVGDAAAVVPGGHTVSTHHEGYEYGHGTGIGWASGSTVYVNNSHVMTTPGKPALAFFAPNLSGIAVNHPVAAIETIVFVNGQPVGTVIGTPRVAVAPPTTGFGATNMPSENQSTTYFISGSAEADPVLPELGFEKA